MGIPVIVVGEKRKPGSRRSARAEKTFREVLLLGASCELGNRLEVCRLTPLCA